MRQVAGVIDEGIRAALPQLGVLVLEMVEPAVRGEENVARQRAESLKTADEISGDLGIHNVAGIGRSLLHSNASEDHHVVGLPAVLDFHGPSGAALRVARGEMGHERNAAQLDLIAIVQDTVDRVWLSART